MKRKFANLIKKIDLKCTNTETENKRNKQKTQSKKEQDTLFNFSLITNFETACHSFNFLISRGGGDEGEERGGKDGSDNFLMGRKKEAEQPFFDLKMAIFTPRNDSIFISREFRRRTVRHISRN